MERRDLIQAAGTGLLVPLSGMATAESTNLIEERSVSVFRVEATVRDDVRVTPPSVVGRPPITTKDGVFVSHLHQKDLNRVVNGAIVYDQSGQVKEMSSEGFKPAALYALDEREAGVKVRNVDPVTPTDVTKAASRGRAMIRVPGNGTRSAGKATPLAEIMVVHEGTKRFLAHPAKIVAPLRSKMGEAIIQAKSRADRTEQSLGRVLSNDHMQRKVEYVEDADVFLIDETVKTEVNT